VTMPQFRVLVILTSGGPLRTKTLADRMGALPSTFTRALDRMVERGWIERVASATDRREILVRATPQGRAIVDEVTERRRTELSRILARVSPDDQVILQRGLEIFSAAAQEDAPEDLIILGL
jgi:DNA-binding MarR family transcriptional regulator